MTMITLNTRLNDGIRQSEGGVQIITHRTWKATPRNLLLAVRELERHEAHMAECYGNVGCGKSWLEYGNTQIRETWLISDTFDAKQWLARFPTPGDLDRYYADEDRRYNEELERRFAYQNWAQEADGR